MNDCIEKIQGTKNCLECTDYNYPCAINNYQIAQWKKMENPL
jgi:hypothetical protein